MHFTVEAQNRIRLHIEHLNAYSGVTRYGDERNSTAVSSEATLSEKGTAWGPPLCAVDATAGNGFDTEFLSKLVGESGRVLAIDLQPAAIESTKQRLVKNQAHANVDFAQGSHALLNDYVQHFRLKERFGEQPFAVAMFNLGYLPFGDKSVITRTESTLPALDQAFLGLKTQGILSLLSYPGHQGGSEEHLNVEDWVERHAAFLSIERFQDEGNPRSPVLWLAVKK